MLTVGVFPVDMGPAPAQEVVAGSRRKPATHPGGVGYEQTRRRHQIVIITA